MKAKQLLSIIFLSTSLLAQGHMLRPDQNAVTVSFGYDRSLDFFGEGKLLRDSYNNSLNLSYIYNGFLGFDFSYGYSLFIVKIHMEMQKIHLIFLIILERIILMLAIKDSL